MLAISLARRGSANAWCVFYAVADLAAHAARVGQWQRAARLLGATDAFLAPTGRQNQSPERLAILDKSRAAAQAHLGEEAFARAWAEGQAMTIDEAGRYALTDADL